MNVSRGDFLKVCAAALLGVNGGVRPAWDIAVHAAGGATEVLPAAGAARFDWTRASAEFFRPHVSTVFAARQGDGPSHPLRLGRVIERMPGPGMQQFSLVFDGPAAAALHGTCTISHAVLGEFDLFLSPVRAARGRGAYEACVSRLPERRRSV